MHMHMHTQHARGHVTCTCGQVTPMAVAMEVVEPLVEPELEGGLLRKKT